MQDTKDNRVVNNQSENDVWVKTLNEVVDFNNKNGRFPNAYSSDKTERKLGMWLNENKCDYAKKSMSLEHAKQFQNAGLYASQTLQDIKRLGMFVTENMRAPTLGEPMYNAYTKVTRLYNSNQLTDEELKAFKRARLFYKESDYVFFNYVRAFREQVKNNHGRWPSSSQIFNQDLYTYLQHYLRAKQSGLSGPIKGSAMTYEQRYHVLERNGFDFDSCMDVNILLKQLTKNAACMRTILTKYDVDCYHSYAKNKENILMINNMRQSDAYILKQASPARRKKARECIRQYWKSANGTVPQFLVPSTSTLAQENERVKSKHLSPNELKFLRKNRIAIQDQNVTNDAINAFFVSQYGQQTSNELHK